MADNINTRDDNLKDLPATERAGDTAIPANEQENLTQLQTSENMEVHHHSHKHGKKNLRAYVWEFIMLFLAIFCGFLAEYFLEHRIEKERGKQYVESMIEDMVSDSIKINESLLLTKKQELGLDSLALLVSDSHYDDKTVKAIYLLMLKYTLAENYVDFTKRTITQLRNSGGMRLIPNKISADEITRYSELVENVEFQGQYYAKNGIEEIIKLNHKIFNLSYTRELHDIDGFLKSQTVKLANDDRNLLIEYSNVAFFTSIVIKYYNQQLSELKAQIPKTIAILKKENHIE